MDDQNASATKGDLATFKDEIVEATKGDLATLKDEIVDVIRDSETKLLNAFYGYAKSNDKRVLETEANEAVLRSRVATLEPASRKLNSASICRPNRRSELDPA